MTKVYPGIVYAEEDGYWIDFPDLKGCQTQGDDVEDLALMAEEALGLYLATCYEENIDVPPASAPEDIKTDKGTVCLISTDPSKYFRDTKAVKRMISLPAWMAKAAEEANLSLSKVLQEGLQQKIAMF